MKKVTDFLEKNCQWIAICLGAAYLLWMVYSFVLTTTAFSVEVGGEKKSPGDVDEAVASVADQLQVKIASGPTINFTVPNFDYVLDLNPKPMPEFTLAWANSMTQDVLPPAPVNNVAPGPNPGNGPSTPNATLVVELPGAPAATDLGFATGRSNVVIPPQAPIGIAAPNGGNQPPDSSAVGTDIDWVTVSYKIPVADIAKEFQRTSIPDKSTTCMLNVDLVRQELQPDGSWGGDTVCQKLTTSTQPLFPPDKATPKEDQPYLNWAVAATPEIVQPTFYNRIKGDPWTLPTDLVPQGASASGDNSASTEVLGPNDVRKGFDPTQYLDPKVAAAAQPPLTNKEKQLVAQARQQAAQKAAQDKAKSAPAPTPGPRSGPPPGARGGGRRGVVQDDGRPSGRDMSRVMGDAPPARLPIPPQAGGAAPPQPAAPAAPATPQPPQNFSQLFPPLPQGEFDPRTYAAAPAGGASAGMIVGWAHDWKAEPGKTYRYAIRYKIKNPVWGTGNVTKTKDMANQFAIQSPVSAWTNPVTVPAVVSFFVMGFRAPAQVEVFRWQDGQLHKESFTVSPGDEIGSAKGDIDFSTGYTLVKMGGDSRGNVTALLLNPDGLLIKRDVKADQSSPQRQQLEQQAGVGATAAAGGPGGTPALINPTR